jgi:hypothetical protein
MNARIRHKSHDLAMRKASLADSLPAIGCGGYSDELPSLAVLPAVGGDDVDRLPDLGVWAQDLPSIDERLSNALPAIDALLVVGSDDVDDSCDLPVLELADSEVSGVSAVGGCDRSTHLPAVETLAARAAAGNLESDGLPDCVTPDIGQEPSGKSRAHKRKHKPKDVPQHCPERLASANIPWKELPYLRSTALRDIPTAAGLYGADLLNELPEADWLNVKKAKCFLDSFSSRWRHIGTDGVVQDIVFNRSVSFLEIFAGCGNLSLAVAQMGLRVGPGIDRRQGQANDFEIDLRKESDRRAVWALVVVLMPAWIHLA